MEKRGFYQINLAKMKNQADFGCPSKQSEITLLVRIHLLGD